MDRAEEIDAFVHQSFNMYGLDFEHFCDALPDYDLEKNPPVVVENINMDLLSQAAMALGISTEALMQMDKDAVRYWHEKYPYFELRAEFEAARRHSSEFASSPNEILIDAIFNEDYSLLNHRRYKGDVRKRLVELLKSYNNVMPGCYHEGSEITRLTYHTNNFTHFNKIADLAESYLSMVNRAKELFYRLWDEELPETEVNEYNFLVSVLGMRDAGYAPSRPIYYKTARKFAPIYKQEGYTDYLSYIMYRDADFPEFYACKEFYDYPDLIERMVQEFPEMKAKIGEMAIGANNFCCSFVWSDEPEPPIDACYDKYLAGLRHYYFGDDTPSWYHRVYVPKTEDELHGDEKYIAICERLSAPESQGGLKIPVPEFWRRPDRDHEGARRIIARVEGGSQHE